MWSSLIEILYILILKEAKQPQCVKSMVFCFRIFQEKKNFLQHCNSIVKSIHFLHCFYFEMSDNCCHVILRFCVSSGNSFTVVTITYTKCCRIIQGSARRAAFVRDKHFLDASITSFIPICDQKISGFALVGMILAWCVARVN